MFGPFALWAPEYNLPLSGNVDQEILLGAVSNRIAGVPEIEREVVTEVASYGDQLSTLIRAVQVLARHLPEDLPKEDQDVLDAVTTLHDDIKETKTRCRGALAEQASLALQRLRDADEDAWKALRQKD